MKANASATEAALTEVVASASVLVQRKGWTAKVRCFLFFIAAWGLAILEPFWKEIQLNCLLLSMCSTSQCTTVLIDASFLTHWIMVTLELYTVLRLLMELDGSVDNTWRLHANCFNASWTTFVSIKRFLHVRLLLRVAIGSIYISYMYTIVK